MVLEIPGSQTASRNDSWAMKSVFFRQKLKKKKLVKGKRKLTAVAFTWKNKGTTE